MDFLKSVFLPVIASSVLLTNLNKHNAVTYANNNRDMTEKTILDTDTNAIAKQENLHDLETKQYWKRVALDFRNNDSRKLGKARIDKIILQLEASEDKPADLLLGNTKGVDLSDTTGQSLNYKFQTAFNNVKVGYRYNRKTEVGANSDTTYKLIKEWSIQAINGTDTLDLKWHRLTNGIKSEPLDSCDNQDLVNINFFSQKEKITTHYNSSSTSSHTSSANPKGTHYQPAKQQPANKKRVPE